MITDADAVPRHSRIIRTVAATLTAGAMFLGVVGGTVVPQATATPAPVSQVGQISPGAPFYLMGTLTATTTTVDPQLTSTPQAATYNQYDKSILQQGSVQQAWVAEPNTRVQAPVIAVVDSGVNPSPDFAGRLLPQANFYPENGNWGADCSSTPSTCMQDDVQHGTYVAMVAAGGASSGSYTTGVCPTCEILPVRVGGDNVGGGSSFFSSTNIAAGIYYAANQPGVDVINISLAGFGDTAGTFNAAPLGQPEDLINSGSVGMIQYAVNYAVSKGGHCGGRCWELGQLYARLASLLQQCPVGSRSGLDRSLRAVVGPQLSWCELGRRGGSRLLLR